MKIVKEHINEFKQGLDNPYDTMGIGKESYSQKQKMYDKLEQKGVKFWLNYAGFNREQRKDYLIGHIYEIEEFINKLIKVGVKYEDIECSDKNRYNASVWRVLSSNRVIAYFFSEEDAINFVSCWNAFGIESYDMLSIEYEKTSSNSIYKSDHSIQMLDNLLANRKKYKKLND